MREWSALWRKLADMAGLMVGQTPYHAYRAHMAAHHPDETVMDERTFFRDRQQARYGGRGGGRCC